MTHYQRIIDKYYKHSDKSRDILITHSKLVCDKALQIISKNPSLKVDENFIIEAAMLHDIGIFMTQAPVIGCYGEYPYICHGYLGRELLEREGIPEIALVAERHTGVGLSLYEIEMQNMPIPHRDMLPKSTEEKIICFADKFYSKSKNLTTEIPLEIIRKKLIKHGISQLKRFDIMCEMFL